MIDWNVIITVRGDFDRAIGILRRLGTVERTGLFNVLVMSVPDLRAFVEQVTWATGEHFFETISHVVPITEKIEFETAEDLERKARDIAFSWAPLLAGKTMHVRMRRRGHKGVLHAQEIERWLGETVFEELERRGTPCRFALDDPDVVIAIETLRNVAGIGLWTRADLERYPWLRASIERGASRHAAIATPESAPSRELLAVGEDMANRPGPEHSASTGEIVDLLGAVEPLTLDRLLATGATIGEIAEAVGAIEDEQAFGEVHHSPSTQRVAEVQAILEDLMFESFEEREGEREIVRT